mmetsp:Transcript_565/g.761  ORF Transcript_565/g.761 Transcript_565/m.761 type:complete len:192 (-) Transcript_565:1253-1828(-)
MGNGPSRAYRGILSRNHRRVVVLGLDSAGKTTVLNTILRVTSNKKETESAQQQTVPTVEFTIKTVKYKRWKLFITDVGGQDSLRPFWRHHFTGLQGVIYVVDCSDKNRIPGAMKELNNILQDDQLRGIPVLIFANKQDLQGASTTEEISNKLAITEKVKKSHLIKVQGGSGKSGEGVFEGLDWLCNHSETL